MDPATLYVIITMATGEERLASAMTLTSMADCERLKDDMGNHQLSGLKTRYECVLVIKSDLNVPSLRFHRRSFVPATSG